MRRDHFKAILSLEVEEIGSVVVEKKGGGVTTLTMVESSVLVLVGLLVIFLVVFLSFLFFFACARWWRWRWRWTWLRSYTTLSPDTRSRPHAAEKVDDMETPLFSEDLDCGRGRTNNLYGKFISEDSNFQINRNMDSPRRQGLPDKQQFVSKDLHVNQGDSIVLDVDPEASEDLLVGQTLKRPAILDRASEDVKHVRKEEDFDLEHIAEIGRQRISALKDNSHQRSCLNLEVISGPSSGVFSTWVSTDVSRLQVTLGRVPPSDLLLKDLEVSGKHALISWNTHRSRWELVDVGSLNGTFLNSQAIHHPDSGYRHWSEPAELANGDMITLGTSSKISVHIMPFVPVPFGIGIASDPMAMRRGGKKFPMEDMHYCQWPLPGVEQFGLFGIFDGHGGAGAARVASKMLPLKVANILADPETKERVISLCNASEVLKNAFSQTEAAMNHQYEGCTATALLVWADHSNQFFAQCANVGDSACVTNINGATINMTEDHRVASLSERTRLREAGMPLNDGETRLCGLNLARMLGDKFLKEQDPHFSSVPFISQVVHIKRTRMDFALLASDGLWDVISIKRVVQLVLQMKDGCGAQENLADVVANFVLNEARTLRTKDNTSIIFLDFDTMRTDHCNIAS